MEDNHCLREGGKITLKTAELSLIEFMNIEFSILPTNKSHNGQLNDANRNKRCTTNIWEKQIVCRYTIFTKISKMDRI